MRLQAVVTGDLRAAMEQEIRATSAALKRAVTTAGREVQAELRQQARAAGFADGGRAVANAWRLNVFPRPGVGPRTLRPAAFVTSNVPEIVDAFERAPLIRAKGGKYLAVPTAINRQGGRRGSKPRVTTAQMAAPGSGAFVRPMRNGRGKLWCIRLRAAQSLKNRRGTTRTQVYAGGTGVQLYTGNRGNQQGTVRRKLVRGFEVMFLLLPAVQARKLLDVASVRGRASGLLASAVVRELGAIAA